MSQSFALRASLGIALPLSLACRPAGGPAVDLVRTPELLRSGEVAGRDAGWVAGQYGKAVRMNDEVRRTLPAAPPSSLTFELDVPPDGVLSLHYAVGEEFHDRPAVEFRVRARRDGVETTLWTSLLDPLTRPEQRHWMAARIDLASVAGRGVELILETSGFDERPEEEPRRALWASPAITRARPAPLAIIYLVDTLRADHTTPYGYERDTTPELQRFAQDSVVFEAAISHASWTKPSVASIFTSQLPGRHLAVQLRDPLDSGHVTLAEMLQVKGLATGAAIANSVIYGRGNNFEQGFDMFVGLHDATGHASKSVDAVDVVDAGLAWLESRAGLPTFLYLHTMDPHVPYIPPAPFDRRYEPYPTPEHPGVDPRTDYKEPLDRERLVAQYDGEIAYGDREFGRFIAELKRSGRYDDALIVFIADHGEEFLDHGKWLHGRSVFDELIRVPLIVKFPGNAHAGRRVAQQVQAVDVLPTVLQALELPVPGSPVIAGQPLQTVVAGGAPEPPAVSEISHRGIVAHGMRTARDKYVRSFSPDEAELFFDLVADPREQTNLLDSHARRASRLRAALEAAMVHDPYRRHLRFVGRGRYELLLRTPGWIDGVEPSGLERGERYEVEGNGRKLALVVSPTPGAPREIAFSVRPLGAPVWLEGTRDGRPLRPSSVFVAESGAHPSEIPMRLPESESEEPELDNLLAPPRSVRDGILLWLTPIPGRSMLDFDAETIEQLKALGYLGG